ncbi:MAG: hypothetical protein R3270_00215 [Gammaproteobacteria bacterium]|nr:hypothetical protein [Gammaproteobacteria bacterium]
MSDRADLERRRDELMERLERIKQDLARGLDKDLEDQSQQLENRDALLEIERVTREELREVQVQIEQRGEE